MTRPPIPQDQLITKQEAADRIGVHIATIDRALRDKKLTRFSAKGNDYFVRLDPREVDDLRVWRPKTGPAATD